MQKEYPPTYEQSVAAQPPPVPASAAAVITSSVVIVPTNVQFGPTSASVICPYCHDMIETELVLEPDSRTHLWALMLCFCGGLLCACLPYCIDSCQEVRHHCPKCGAYLGRYTN